MKYFYEMPNVRYLINKYKHFKGILCFIYKTYFKISKNGFKKKKFKFKNDL